MSPAGEARARAEALRAYAEQIPVVLSVPNFKQALLDAAADLDRLTGDVRTLQEVRTVWRERAEAAEARVAALTETLERAVVDIQGIVYAGFDSTRRQLAIVALGRISSALAAGSTAAATEPKDPGSHGRDSAASRAACSSSEIDTDALSGPAASDFAGSAVEPPEREHG